MIGIQINGGFQFSYVQAIDSLKELHIRNDLREMGLLQCDMQCMEKLWKSVDVIFMRIYYVGLSKYVGGLVVPVLMLAASKSKC